MLVSAGHTDSSDAGRGGGRHRSGGDAGNDDDGGQKQTNNERASRQSCNVFKPMMVKEIRREPLESLS